MTKRLKKLAVEVARIVMETEKWEEAKTVLMNRNVDKVREWVKEEEDKSEKSAEGLLKQIGDSVAVLAAEGRFVSPTERQRANKIKQKKEAERKAEEDKRAKNRGVSKLLTQERKEEEKGKEEAKKRQQAENEEDTRLIEITNYQIRYDTLLTEYSRENEAEKKDLLRPEMSKIHAELEEAKQRKITFEGDEFKFTTGEKRTRCRKVFLVVKMSGKKIGKPGEEQIKWMKEKVND